ncbi:MAG: hypothetical protein R3C26_02315 [Calditrichia bacterium]
MALEIFDQTQKLHGLGTPERSLLNYAALLHSIGQYINFKSYHRHSKYIISHAQLRGFTDEEVLLIGNVVRFHRKSEPQKSDEIKEFSRNQRRILQILAAMLRVAVGLDRGQTQSVKQLALEIEDKQIHIFISGKGDLELDLWGARRLVEPLERALERKIVIEKLAGSFSGHFSADYIFILYPYPLSFHSVIGNPFAALPFANYIGCKKMNQKEDER